ncbi:MAG TPA: alpha/beta hydrolase [Anaerolineales bacterium]|nr:alpha/beta hydrolase [Anaerolineales bacterium]
MLEIHGPPQGQPVVLLHHGLGAVRSWRGQFPALAAAGYRAIAYDRWGFGRSDPRQVYAIPNFQEDVADLKLLLKELDINQPALIGHSDGGKVAMYYAAAYPGKVAALVLIATHAYIEPKMEDGIRQMWEQYGQDARFRGQLGRVHGDQAEAVFQGWFSGWINPGNAGWDLRPLLREIDCPALVVQGLEDEHASPGHARQIAAALPNAGLWLAPDAGHMLPQDFPQALNTKLVDFLANVYLANRVVGTSAA